MFGTTQIAANAIANNLDGMGVLPGQAMNLAMITVVGRCVGAGDFDQAGYYAKKMMKITYLVNGLCCIAVILTMLLSLSLYGLSREALELGAAGVWWAMIADWSVRSAFFGWRFASGKWKTG